MQGGLLLNVVVLQSTAILKLFASKDQTLLIWGNAFLVLDLLLHGFDGIGILNFQGNSFAGQCLHKDLHTTTQTEHKVQSGLFLDVVILQRTAIFKLLPGENQTLLIWGNAFLVLDLLLHRLDGIRVLNLECDCLACQCFNKDLH